MIENCLVSPKIIALNGNTSGQNQAQLMCGITGSKDRRIFRILPLSRI